jgi:Domain of unknown function (DUF1707)
MSNQNGEAPGSEEGIGSTTRVGTAERDEALARLAEHWQAGRLDPAEHELRVTKARAAVTQADLDALFTDLPQPDPPRATTGAVTTTGNRDFLEGRRETIMALTPFAALVLFFITHTWLWFLMVPVMGILVYGPGGNRDGRKDSRRRGR